MIKIALFIFVLLISLNVLSQNDSTTFSYKDFISIVKKHHPISYQAGLKIAKGEAGITKAKGGFDPKLQGDISQKYFEEKQYYSYLNAGLKIPTWFGVSLQGGYGNTNGYYLNPESLTPNEGLWYAGVTLNLGKGLIIDARRADIKQAKIYQNSTAVEQKLMLNQLTFDASIAYWNWYKAHNKVKVYENAVQKAFVRYEGIKQSAFLGDKPFIDTLKAVIQIQDRQLNLERSILELLNKKAMLETYLWQDGAIPLIIDTILKPENYKESLPSYPKNMYINGLDSLVNNHPEMLYYQYDIDIAKIDYRLKKESLKPTLQLKYNALSSPVNQSVLGEYSLSNYNWGATIAYPIFTRKERGNVQLSELKIKEQESQLLNKKASINYKITASYNTWKGTSQQLDIYMATVTNYEALSNAELTLFEIGESSLFLVNYREQELIKAQINLIELFFTNYVAAENYKFQTVAL